MTTIQERHLADQDDADRYADRYAQRNGHVAEMATEIERLRQKYNALRAEYDGLRVEWGEALETIRLLKAGREERDATIERVRVLVADRMDLASSRIRAALDAPTEPAPELEVTPDAPSPRLIQAGDHVYVWRESDVVDGTVHPLAHGVYVPHDVNPVTYAFTVNGACKGCQP